MNKKYIIALEEFNKKYQDLYNHKALRKYRRNQRIKEMIIHGEIKNLFLKAFKKCKNNKTEFLKPIKYNNKMGKNIVYTCILNNYDNLYDPLIESENTDYVVFSDNPNIAINSKYWTFKLIPKVILEKCNNNPTLVNRYLKMHPYEVFKDYDYSLYIDGTIEVVSDINDCFNYINKKTGLAMHDHRSRNDVYQEAKACVKQKVGNKEKIIELMNKYQLDGFKENYGLLEATVIASDLNNSKSVELLDLWYKDFIESKCFRDQLVLPYILYKNNLKINDVGIMAPNLSVNYKFIRHIHIKRYNNWFSKIKVRIINFGFKYKCEICHSHLNKYLNNEICPVCKTTKEEREVYKYLENKTLKNILIVNADFKVTTYKLKKKGVSVICISDDKISNFQKDDCLIYKIDNGKLKKLNKLFDEKNYNIIKLDDKIFVIEKK